MGGKDSQSAGNLKEVAGGKGGDGKSQEAGERIRSRQRGKGRRLESRGGGGRGCEVGRQGKGRRRGKGTKSTVGGDGRYRRPGSREEEVERGRELLGGGFGRK
ncbi:unnamed protein product [Linum trigynum]|uniref:Uncharacterized protein n=1 Tax=Linum trigynum TaxID=586398 RepID=A0AAV2FNY1_9ROSI